MSEEKNEKKGTIEGIYIAFKSNKGRALSEMKLRKAKIVDISNAIIWCEMVKEGLLEKYKELTGGLRWDKKDKKY